MKAVDLALKSLDGFLFSIKRNPIKGWYELEIGINKSWVYNENKEISCELITENDEAILLKISPKNNRIVVDDLIAFVELIIETNKKIAEKEKEFADKMNEMKGILEKEAKKFYEELDSLKENSFKNLNDNFVKNFQSGEKKTTTRKGRPSKISEQVSQEEKEKNIDE